MDNTHHNDPQISRIQWEKIQDQVFLNSTTRPTTCADLCYPASPEPLRLWLDQVFAPYKDLPPKSVSALYAPHIDFRVNMDIYAHAFSHLRHLRPKRIFLLGTSHYSGLYWPQYDETPFILTEKDFETPLGPVSTDKKLVQKIVQESHSATSLDLAHRIEHSLELHVVLLKYLWSHSFQIVPILVGGFDELLYTSQNPTRKRINEFSEILKSHIQPEDLVLVSGDLSHIGRKFGDSKPASQIIRDAKKNDIQFLQMAARGDSEEMISLMQRNEDEFRICGFPPLLTFLEMFKGREGKVMQHNYWDESDMESGVSFGTVLYS